MAAANSPFVLCKIRQPISLLPCHIGESRVGIDQEMTALLMQYSDKLQGVILSFSNVKLEKPAGFIMNEQPYIHCKVVADALVFKPREGMTLQGVVNKIGSNHVGMLFAGVFNGSVAASELPQGFVHNYAQDSWMGADGSSISMDDTVEVTVVRVHVAGGMIAIEASMRATAAKSKAKSQRRKSVDVEAASEPAKKSKKDKKSKDKQQHTEEEVAPAPVATKKRKKDQAAKKVEEPVQEVEEVETTPSKKKKSKKSKKE